MTALVDAVSHRGDTERLLGAEIASARTRQSITLEGLAGLAKIPTSTLLNYEAGSARPSEGDLLAIVVALRVSVSDIFQSVQRHISGSGSASPELTVPGPAITAAKLPEEASFPPAKTLRP
jgi:transcriptional regulator with XRE-family HTH domain